jgi:hypothetical protein
MKTKLGMVIAVVETAAVFFTFLLLKQVNLPAQMSVILFFLLPVTFGAHVFEEFFFPGGAEDWFRAYNPQFAKAYTSSYFLKVNAIPLMLSGLLPLGTLDYSGSYSLPGVYAWFVFLSFLTINGIFHIRATIKAKAYSPGTVTSLVLYVPLAVTSLIYFWQSQVVNIFLVIICLALGTVLQPILDSLKKQKGKEAGQ